MNQFDIPFSWDTVINLVENMNNGIVVREYEDEIEFDFPDCSWAFYVNPKEVTTWNNLKKEIYDRYVDFDLEEYVMGWLEARKNGIKNVPDVFKLVENARDIDAWLNDLVILLVNYKTDQA